ncbi:hypothetical protein [Bradyrhizobium sp. BR 1432]|uniref:hypothetical protein n=1 Tax=Bradyrhizobium sp. BR 1432 TaxID=3447966 RepID=UPI003EE6BF98
MEGADVYQIAKNCRTSVQMIEDFYASHIESMVDPAVVNVRRPREAHKTQKSSAIVGESAIAILRWLTGTSAR